MTYRSGSHFLQIPGPANVPGRVLRAIEKPTIDHRGPEFQALSKELLERIKLVFQTKNPVVIFPSSGTGAWEAALVNTLSPGDKVLMFETGQFSSLWTKLAEENGLKPEVIPSDWRRGVDAAAIGARLAEDKAHEIKAVCVVQNETSSAVLSSIPAVRKAIDAAKHPALLMVDSISGLGSAEYRHDEWGVDVTIAGSQKGLMLPPGLGFNAISDKALKASETAGCRRSYWSWKHQLGLNKDGWFPYTPATNLLYGLKEACDMLLEEGLENTVARHERFAESTRRAVRTWGLELVCQSPEEYSPALTAVMLPEGHNADEYRAIVLDKFDMSLGTGLGKFQGKVFRIGHLGYLNELMLMGTLSGIEMGLSVAGIPHEKGGVQAAMDYLTGNA